MITDIKQLSPKVHVKYSPNLYKWLLKRKRDLPEFDRSTERILQNVYSDGNGKLWIGWMESDRSWLHGCSLMSILCYGVKANDFAYYMDSYEMKNRFSGDLNLLPNFWQEYQDVGRCAIDRDHQLFEERWKTYGDKRECLWCGKHSQRLVTLEEVVVKSRWENDKDT